MCFPNLSHFLLIYNFFVYFLCLSVHIDKERGISQYFEVIHRMVVEIVMNEDKNH